MGRELHGPGAVGADVDRVLVVGRHGDFGAQQDEEKKQLSERQGTQQQKGKRKGKDPKGKGKDNDKDEGHEGVN